MAHKTEALTPKLTSVPWVALNHDSSKEINVQARTNLFRLVCNMLAPFDVKECKNDPGVWDETPMVELTQAGTPMVELTQAGTPMVELSQADMVKEVEEAMVMSKMIELAEAERAEEEIISEMIELTEAERIPVDVEEVFIERV